MTFCKKLTIPFPYEQNLFHATDLFLYTLKTKRQIFLVFLGNKEETSGLKSINGSKGFINPAWKVSKYGVISSPYFPAFGLNSGKYRPEITPYLDTFHAVPHCVKSVQIQRFSGSYFPTFGLNTEIYTVFLRIQSECGKIRTRKTSVFGHFSCNASVPILN